MTGTSFATASRNRRDSGSIHASASFTLIGPPIMPMPANALAVEGTESPSSIANSRHGTAAASSHCAKCAGPSVGLKRNTATGRIGRQVSGIRKDKMSVSLQRDVTSRKRSRRLLVGDQPVTDSGLGHEMRRPDRVALELVAQLLHVNAQVMRIGGVRRSPHLRQQLAMRDDHAGMLGERRQQPEL